MTWHPLLRPGLCRNLGEGRGAGPGPEQGGDEAEQLRSPSTHAPASSLRVKLGTLNSSSMG